MWSAAAVLLLALTLSTVSDAGEVFDVTTVFNADFKCNNDEYANDDTNANQERLTITKQHCSDGVGYVHARTNANGLPLYDGNSDHIESNNTQMFNITCDTERSMCSWDNKDWMWTLSTIWSSVEEKKRYFTGKAVNVKLENVDYPENLYSYLYFTSDKLDIKNQNNFVVVRMNGYRSDTMSIGLYRNCYTRATGVESYTLDVIDYDGTLHRVWCNQQDDLPQSDYRPFEMTFKFNEQSIQIRYRNRYDYYHYSYSEYYEKSFEYNSGNIKYFSMTGPALHRIRPSVHVQELSANKDGSEMVSPLIVTDSLGQCLVLVLHSEATVPGELLQVLSRDLLDQDQLLHAVTDVKQGWNVKQFNITLATTLQRLVIRLTGQRSVKIRRISSCSPDGGDIIPVKINTTNKVYRVSSDVLVTETVEVKENSKNNCLNGGVLTTAGCACPPGFHGTLCRSGCGRNRFGMDCGGVCSLWTQECEGLKLCTNFTGCHCAPGYYGQFCKEICWPGFYGNDCLWRCGHCGGWSRKCDVYTGTCDSCEPGFVPPYCDQVYVYSSSAPRLSSSYDSIEVSFEPQTLGVGTPKLYQVQYKEKEEDWYIYTTKLMPSVVETSTITETIKGLKYGVLYQVRIILMDKGFNKYDGDRVPVAEIITNCDIPDDEFDYGITSSNNATSITFSWDYTNKTKHWCRAEDFEIFWKTNLQWASRSSPVESLTLTNLLPGSSVNFKMRAKTILGFAPISKTVRASTSRTESSAVRNLHEVSAHSTSVELAWLEPMWSNTQSQQYTIKYKCVDRVACSPGCENTPQGELTQGETSVTISPLLPFTKYLITVTPIDGPDSSIYVGTSETVPTERPQPSSEQHARSNTSVTVSWAEEAVCTGFLQGYNYQLTKTSDELKILASGFTKEKEVTLNNLTASTQYQVKVHVVNIAGWNPEAYLVINVSTSATVPEAVRNLTVYKRSRNMLGLRWAEPRATYGKLKSFTITHTLGQGSTSDVIEPSHCVPWPHLFCHTIEGLKANRKYNITVSARNVDVEEDGDGASVIGLTRETSPTAAENLKLLNSSSTSVSLEWHYPSLANGVVRSFLVNVEETEQYDQNSCCQVYPLLETPVQEELEAYRLEVSGLHPASTYYVSVTAKTVALGPSLPLVVYTRPPLLPFTLLPSQDILQDLTLAGEPLTWSASQHGNSSDVYSSLVQGHIILAVLNSSDGEVVSGVENSDLDSLLKERISSPFYFVAEYNEEGVVSSSVWGQPPCPLPSRVSLTVAQVSQYNNVYNVNLRFSNTSVTFNDCI